MSSGTGKNKSTRKAKAEAKKILTRFIREIASETHEDPLITGDGINDAHMITKAEALARFIWKAATGYKEKVEVIDKTTDRVTGEKEVIHFPDKHYIDILLDRMEGKVAPVEPEKASTKASVADKVREQSKDRLNNLAKK